MESPSGSSPKPAALAHQRGPGSTLASRARAAAGRSSAPRARSSAAGPKDANGRAPSRAAAASPADVRARDLEKLWKAYRRRPSDDLRNQLVESYQPLLHEVVRRFALRLPRSIDRGDLGTAANFGLMAAIEGYDVERGLSFEAYCELRVKGALRDELRSQDWLSRPWRARLELQKRVVERLRAQRGAEPDDTEVAAAMEMAVDEYRLVFGVGLPGTPAGSGAAPGAAESEAPGLDVVPDPDLEAQADRLSREEILRLVTQRLSVQEYRVVYLKYWEELSMREIGEMMGLSESRVSKIHARLIDRLKDRFGA